MELAFTKNRHHRMVMGVLGACNGGALLAAINLVTGLNPEDRISVKRGGALTMLGFVYFLTLFELLNVAALFTGAGARFRHKYRLSCGEVLDITNKIVSAVQAAFSCATGFIVCAWSCTRDFMRSSHFMSEAYAWFGAAYFFYDIWSMYMVHVHMVTNSEYYVAGKRRASDAGACRTPAGGECRTPAGDAAPPKRPSFLAYCRHEPVILMHHMFIGGFGFLVIVYLRGGLGDCVFGWVYLMELSTPLVSVRGVLARLRLQRSRAYRANGLAMLSTFLLCRVLALPFVALHYSYVQGLTYLEAIKSLPTGCKISICILLLPQLYWFYLMSRGAIKIFFGKAYKLEECSSTDSPSTDVSILSAGDTDKRS